MSRLGDVQRLVDEAAGERVVVYGSRPPEARDLDLLCRPSAERSLRLALGRAGYDARDCEHVLFAHGTAQVVDVTPARDWNLPRKELGRVFGEATALPGRRHLCLPAPHHQLLILARRVAVSGGLDERRLGRAREAFDAHRDAWGLAEQRAPLWAAQASLERLRRALDGHRGLPLVPAPRRVVGRVVRPRIVALSGVDGSGKSTQARALRTALTALGYEATIVWAPLADNPGLARVASVIKAGLGCFPALREADHRTVRGRVPDAGSALRHRSPVAHQAWVIAVALANGLAHARGVAREAPRGRVVIFDRYVLDSLARLRFFYGENAALRLPRAIVRALSPPPAASFFLDLPAELSAARKDDGWTAEDLRNQVRLYRQEASRLGVVRLDATADQAQLSAQIARTVWMALRE